MDNTVSMTDTDTLSEVTAEDLQKLRRLVVEVATYIVKGNQKAALASLQEVEAIVMREQQGQPPPPPPDSLPPG